MVAELTTACSKGHRSRGDVGWWLSMSRLCLGVMFLVGCGGSPLLPDCASLGAIGGADCSVAGYSDRAFDVWLPANLDGPAPVLLALHGGGGNKEGAARTACADGDAAAADCLHAEAAARGVITVYPSGVPGRGFKRQLRSWNSGGGSDGWRCVGGEACATDSDDVSYLRAVIDELAERVPIDRDRVYATGLSNGGAMSLRLACEADDLVAAVVAVGGAMQLIGGMPSRCSPARPVPVLQVHGDADPCWPYDGGSPNCPGISPADGYFVSVEATLSRWHTINGCDREAAPELLPDTVDDGQTTVRYRRAGCAAPVEHLRVDGGGHTWPDGWSYLGERTVGKVTRDWGDELILDFLLDHRRP